MKNYIAYGPGYCGDYDSFSEAISIVAKNGIGAVYKLIPETEKDPAHDFDLAIRQLSREEFKKLTIGDWPITDPEQ